MLDTPKKFTLIAGSAEGPSRLNAFDNALLAAGIGNVNLIRVSSILPPNAIEVPHLEIIPGQLMPTAYGTITSEIAGETISAAVAVGIGEQDEYGVIMEFSGRCGQQEAEETVTEMVRAAFLQRQRELKRVIVRAKEHQVQSIGCAFAAVALWY
ncbi:pyruvoyl-dependent arginine decarboxylase [Sulfobacillus thermosulfidooxidans]|uniref:pyruvoyl-dependent arginine decarboxylase n=1 Tax=Sulfobacillus thermosulfidooxidans TaxID=28034 RepID=UPI00096B840C|nr:arginine decarboxylase, pyruvoyl-dependent [Sulfobacillus thermosulfidooxidans]OLZ11588.1 arginine decarboxylase, pyruvoyl-dependent [Sulfobacillus thermosulfidooxidans]OLZ17430.1 arginine decarboxylase, pyruvoyl-dependent [Sulfobacillus thermosulfidooxidans]OLZ21060.1 arginine decarboxylase, pyruvoyl-dependent [Sulfobacillus thermosulfidooxidans]